MSDRSGHTLTKGGQSNSISITGIAPAASATSIPKQALRIFLFFSLRQLL
jgi:hypothetical protein